MNQPLISMETFSKLSLTFTNFVVVYGIKLISAIFILLIGLWFIKRLTNFLSRVMVRRDVDPSLAPFLTNIASIGLKIILIIIVISQIGIAATSFLAILGSAGIAIGLALQGSLSNFAGGVLLLTIRPFRVGDFIEAQGQSGKVHLINIFNTVIKTGDNKTIFIPNGPLASSTIINYDLEDNRRVDLKFTFDYRNNVQQAREIIKDQIAADSRIMADPAPKIAVSEVTGNAFSLVVRVWVLRPDYWDVFFDLQENLKIEFEKNNFTAPVTLREMVNQPEKK